jgi:hypothetical protein
MYGWLVGWEFFPPALSLTLLYVYEMKGKEMKVDFEKKIKCAYVFHDHTNGKAFSTKTTELERRCVFAVFFVYSRGVRQTNE